MTQSLKLVHSRENEKNKYRVIVAKNNVAYSPGDVLCKDEVDSLCRNARWDITIVGDRREEQ